MRPLYAGTLAFAVSLAVAFASFLAITAPEPAGLQACLDCAGVQDLKPNTLQCGDKLGFGMTYVPPGCLPHAEDTEW